MAAVAFDTLKFARRLMEAGVPKQQAEMQAELMAEAFVFNLDALVTRDYLDALLDAKFAEQEARLEAKFDTRIALLEAKVDAHYLEMQARFAALDIKFAEIEGRFRLVYWMLALIMASTVLPALHGLLAA